MRKATCRLLSTFSAALLQLCANCSAQDKKPAPTGMVLIPGGTVTLGIDSADIPHFQSVFQIDHAELFADEVPKHTVTLQPFYLDKFPVTNAQFFAFTQAVPQWQPANVPASLRQGNYLKHWISGQVPKNLENHPVVNIAWFDANAYCQWRGKRLPIEAEWEHAARGGANGLFPWGSAPADSSRANFSASGFGTTTEVGKYAPNGYGLYDMAGNVWQFLADDWTKYPNHAVTGTAQYVNQAELEKYAIHPNAARKVIRGGSYAGAPINLWVEYRDSHPANGARDFVGFRCAKSVSPKTPPQ